MRDRFPVSNGHRHVIARRANAVTFFELTSGETEEFLQMLEILKTHVDRDLSPNGYKIGINCGVAAGQTVMRFHCDLIPFR